MSPFLDWLGREWGAILSWWALTTLAGVALFPLVFRLARGLPSRGYALARAAGIILIAYVYWILNILGLLQNNAGSAAFVAIVLFIVGLVSYATWREREPLIPWLREHLGLILATELIFGLAFLGWATVRALNPDITNTEKPMEMAFLAATRRSATFPPNDPWMSGYAISYYHFGYIMIATLANLSGVTNGIAFNLSASLLFALTCVGAFSIGYDLIAARQAEAPPEDTRNKLPRKRRGRWTPFAVGVLAAVLIAIMGNLGTAAVELPYQTKALPDSYFRFMDIKERDLTNGCPQTGQFPPNCGWWWFAWSRVIKDRDLSGNPIEIISEFPAFSYVLSDVHPHVLSLPFVLLAIGLMLNLVLSKRGAHPWEFLIYLICIGGLIFLNSWDAVFLGLLIGAEALRRLVRNGTGGYTREDWGGMAGFAGLLIVGTGLLYLPFFISFRSQAGGIVPNLIYPTRFQQFFVMFGTFATILAMFVGAEVWRARAAFNRQLAMRVLIYGVGLVLVLMVVAMITAWTRADARSAVFSVVDQAGGLAAAVPTVLIRRLQGVVTEGFLLLIILGVVGRLFARDSSTKEKPLWKLITYSPSTAFVLLLIGAGAVLALAPDFAYLRDNFGTRINTIFKLYYQTWALWGVASAYAVWSLLGEVAEFRIPAPVRLMAGTAATVLIAAGLIYMPFAVNSRAVIDGGHARTDDPNAPPLTLEGGNTLASGADDYAVISCFNNFVKGDQAVLVEAMTYDSAYNKAYGRVSVLSGIPTVLGWPNHEGQWRGDTYSAAAGTRMDDIGRLYNTLDWKVVQQVIKQYHINYVYVGPTERNVYAESGGLSKFDGLTPICQSGNVAVYPTDAMASLISNPASGG